MRMAVSNGAPGRAWKPLGVVLTMLALGVAWQVSAGPAYATASPNVRLVHFQGRAARVPAGWPVIRLAVRPRACVRLDRRAVYLGRPDPDQRCPADAIGRSRAIVIEPGSSSASPPRLPAVPRAPQARASSAAVSASEPFTGLGFDACTAPSQRTMSAWAESPYRAIGVYISGINRGCSQPNLTASWVATQIAAGWHLIPTYVGLQSPTSSCSSCAEISLSRATIQGTEAADDAVAQAQLLGIGPGNPIYFDMESYTQTFSATNATLAFLEAWTEQLHALGYTSGIYSSGASGIEDLVGQIDSGYALPDDLWIANWNGQATALDPYVPSNAWAQHQRIHQYRGGHNEAYGGVTINIDNDYVDGATVGVAIPEPALPPLSVLHVKPSSVAVHVRVRCGWTAGETCPGQIILRSYVRVLRRGQAGGKPRANVVRVAVGHRTFRLAGGRTHTFKVFLNSRGRPLARERRRLKAQLLVAIPGARAIRKVELSRR